MRRSRYTVRYLRFAEEDLYEIYDYISRDHPANAARFLAELDEAIGRLSHDPRRGRRVEDPRLRERNYRFLSIGEYLAFYRIEDDEVIVYRVLHGARDWARLIH